MGGVRVFKADNQRAEFRRAKPLRYLALENAALSFTRTGAFAGDHQDQPRFARTGGAQKPQQVRVSLALGQAVQIETAVNSFLAARDALFHAAAERSEWRRFVLNPRGLTRTRRRNRCGNLRGVDRDHRFNGGSGFAQWRD